MSTTAAPERTLTRPPDPDPSWRATCPRCGVTRRVRQGRQVGWCGSCKHTATNADATAALSQALLEKGAPPCRESAEFEEKSEAAGQGGGSHSLTVLGDALLTAAEVRHVYCRTCPISAECAAWAATEPFFDGVAGGLLWHHGKPVSRPTDTAA